MNKKDPEDKPFVILAMSKVADISSYDAHMDGLITPRVRSEDILQRAHQEMPELWAWVTGKFAQPRSVAED